MTTIKSLPPELLVRIFEQFDTKSQAAECTLVCRAWQDPAERAMFGYPITINSEDTIQRLAIAFSRDPAKAKLIRHLRFQNVRITPNILDVFLAFALTPSIESITGRLNDKTRDILLHRVKALPPRTFRKTKTLKVTSTSARLDHELSLFFCESLQTLKLHCNNNIGVDWDFMNDLTRFTRLKHMQLDGEIGDIARMNTILDNCQQLEHLTMKHYWTNNLGPFVWDSSIITRKHNLKTLELKKTLQHYYTDFLGYMLHKCTGITKLVVDFEIDEYYSYERHLPLLGSMIQNLPQKEFRVHIDRTADEAAAIRFVRKHFNRVLIDSIANDGAIYLKIEE